MTVFKTEGLCQQHFPKCIEDAVYQDTRISDKVGTIGWCFLFQKPDDQWIFVGSAVRYLDCIYNNNHLTVDPNYQ